MTAGRGEDLLAEPDGLVETAAADPGDPGLHAEHPCPLQLVLTGVGERRLQEGVAAGRVEIDAQGEHVQPVTARREPRQRAVHEGEGARGLPGRSPESDLRQLSPFAAHGVAGGTDLPGMGDQLGGETGRAAPIGAVGGGVQFGRDVGVRLDRGQGQVTGAVVGLGDERGEPGVHFPPRGGVI